jgi:hypothetical protein
MKVRVDLSFLKCKTHLVKLTQLYVQSGQNHIIRIREIKLKFLWLSGDEIMERELEKFLEVGKTKVFSLSMIPSSPK